MGTRTPSLADTQVITAARRAGYTLTARQLERWRQHGLIPGSQVQHLGRGQGSRSSYDKAAVAQIIEAARRVSALDSLAETALCLFAEGFPISEHTVRSSYATFFAQLRTTATKMAGSTDLYAQADALAQQVGDTAQPGHTMKSHKRAARSALQDSAVDLTDPVSGKLPSRRAYIQGVFANLYTIAFAGEMYTEDGSQMMIDQIRYMDNAPSILTSANPDEFHRDDFEANLDLLNIDALTELSQSASWKQLHEGSTFFRGAMGRPGRGPVDLGKISTPHLLGPLVFVVATPRLMG